MRGQFGKAIRGVWRKLHLSLTRAARLLCTRPSPSWNVGGGVQQLCDVRPLHGYQGLEEFLDGQSQLRVWFLIFLEGIYRGREP